MHEAALVKEINEQLQKAELLPITQVGSYDQLMSLLTDTINDLVSGNISLLFSILYRLDISEKKLRLALTQADKQLAGEIIAEMVIERQLQKIAAKKRYKHFGDIPEEDKW